MQVFLNCFLLACAAGLSFRQFMLLYTAAPARVDASPLMPTIATAVFLGALGLALADTELAAFSLILAAAVPIAFLGNPTRSVLPVLCAAACLLAYVGAR
ncbi:hypothetical protein M0654_05405 [Rhizobium sp. NTR19]|uniref:Branched-chain amino acid transport protein (AzlD) n=1 Tax=Neorhizobium turbinariae TaxID=2937795 RepID=A0ABT0INI2_9HYPH|nr:hypothetical protein [Neorhizobium turbinariae]MCK8779419.1 hypothetical protein [Neorhizobium turbinariae]